MRVLFWLEGPEAGGQGGDVIRRQGQARHPVEKSGGLVGREAQISYPQFGQLPAGARAHEGGGGTHSMEEAGPYA